MFFSKSARLEQLDRDDASSELSQITLEYTTGEAADVRVESADVVHSVEPTEEQRNELKREALEQASTPTPA